MENKIKRFLSLAMALLMVFSNIPVQAFATDGADAGCVHTNTSTSTVAATCTEAGSTTVVCDDCGETVSAETISALGHSYTDGVCTGCGAADPDAAPEESSSEAPVVAASDEAGMITVYFDNSAAQWETVYAYWRTADDHDWADDGVKGENDIWTFQIPEDSEKVQFMNSRGASGSLKTSLFTVVKEKTYTYDKIAIYFDNSETKWDDVDCYWVSNSSRGNVDGDKGENDIWTCYVPEDSETVEFVNKDRSECTDVFSFEAGKTYTYTPEVTTVTVYFDNSKAQWESVYAVHADSDNPIPEYVLMTKGENDVWSAEIPKTSDTIGFANDISTSAAYAGPFAVVDGKTYTYEAPAGEVIDTIPELQAAVDAAVAAGLTELPVINNLVSVLPGETAELDLKGVTVTLQGIISYGDLTVKNGTLVGTTGDYSVIDAFGTLVLENVNATGLRHAVHVESGSATIKSGTYSATESTYAIDVGDTKANADVTIEGGSFSSILVHDGSKLIITGGTFYQDPSAYVAEGYECVQDGDAWVVREKSAGTTTIEGTITENMVWNDGDVVAGVTIAGDVTITVKGTVTVAGTIRLSPDSISNVTFNGEDNAKLIRGEDFAGQMFYAEGVSGNFQNLTFNDITLDGGAVWTGDVDKTLNRGTVNSGVKATGSVLYLVYANADLNDSTLQNHDDSTGEKANAVFLRYYSTIDFNDSVVRNNNSPSTYYRGGVITVRQGGTAKTNNSEVYGNSGAAGGFFGISATGSFGGVAEAYNTKFHNNYSDNGAVFLMQCNSKRGYLKIDGCEFYENASKTAVLTEWAYSRPFIISNSSFHDNECAVWDCHADPVLDISGKIVVTEDADYTKYLFETPLVLSGALTEGSSIAMSEASIIKLMATGYVVTGTADYAVTEADLAKFVLPEGYKLDKMDVNGDGISDYVAVKNDTTYVDVTVYDNFPGSEASETQSLPSNVKGLPALNFAHEGCEFLGWMTTADGTEVIKPQLFTEPTELYAKWAAYNAQVGETKYETLAEAVAAANAIEGGATVTLLANVTLGEKLTITGNVTISGEYTITRADSYTGTLFTVNSGATLTLDGGLVVDGANNYAFDAELYAQDLANWETGVPAAENAKWFTPEEGAPVATAYMITTSGTVNLNNVSIKNHYSTNGSGIVSASKGAVVTLTGAQITHNASTNGSGLVVNASADVWSREEDHITITMNEGTVIDGNHVGSNHGIFKIYLGSHLTMNGGVVKNTTGWNSNGTVVGIYFAVFTMNGGTICSNSSVYGSNNGRNGVIYGHTNHLFTMNGGTICHNSGRSKAGVDSPYSEIGYTGQTFIHGGTIVDNTVIGPWTEPDVSGGATLTVTGGTFTQDVTKYLAPDLGVAYNAETGVYSVTDELAEVNGEVYKSVAEAVAAANDGDTVKLLAFHKPSKTIVIDKNITLDLNGKNLLGVTGVNPIIRVLSDVTVTGNGMIDSANQGDGYCFIVGNGEGVSGNLTIENGTFKGTTTAVSVTKGKLTILGGDFRVKPYTDESGNTTYDFLLNCIDANYSDGSAVIEVKGGVFTNFNPANNAAEGANTNFVAEGYISEELTEGKFTVRAASYVAQVGETKYESLAKAVEAANAIEGGATVTLLAEAEVSEAIAVTGNVTIEGNTITWADGYTGTLFNVAEGASLTTKNVTIDGENAFDFYDDTTTVENGQNWYTRFVDVGEEDKAVNANVIVNAGNLTLGKGTKIVNVTIATDHADGKTENTEDDGYYLKYNQDLAIIKSNGGSVTMQGAEISRNAGLILNAINAQTTMQGAKIHTNMGAGNKGGIIIANGGTMNINESLISGNKAMARSATILGVINGAEVTAYNTEIVANKHIGVGPNTAGAMIVLEGASQFVLNGEISSISYNVGGRAGAIASRWVGGTYGQHEDTSIVLNGGTIINNTASHDSWNGASIFLRSPATIGEGMTINGGIVVNAAPGELDITGGTFNGTLTVTDGLSAEITGGTFNYDPTEWVVKGYIANNNGDGTWTVMKHYVAQVGDTKYTSLTEALNACTNGETVILLEDIVYTADDVVYAHGGATGFGDYDQYNPSIVYLGGTAGETPAENQPSNVNAVLDLNGHSITNNAEAYLFMFMDNAKVTIKDSGNGAGIIGNTEWPVLWVTGTDTLVTIANGKYTTANDEGLIWATHSGDLVIEGGEFSTTAEDASLLIMRNAEDRKNPNYFIDGKSTITVKDGIFYGFNPEKTMDDSTVPFTEVNTVAEGYKAEEHEDGYWYIVPKEYVAQVGDTKYETLTEALNACTNGETVILLTDIVYDADDVVNAIGGATGFGDYYNPSVVYLGGTRVDGVNSPSNVNAVLDLNGHSITNNAEAYLFMFMDNAKVTIKDSGNGAGIIGNTNYPVIWVTGTDTLVTIESGKYTTANAEGLIWATHSGDLVIEGGEFSTSAEDASLLIIRNAHDRRNSEYFISGKATVTVTGGSFKGFDPEKTMDDSTTPFTEFNSVAEGYAAIEENGVWTVYNYVEWIKAQLLAGNDVTLEHDIVVDGSMIESIPASTNGNGKYPNYAIFTVIGEEVTFDLNGHSITYNGHKTFQWNGKTYNSCTVAHGLFYANAGADLTIVDSKGTAEVTVYGLASGGYVASNDTKLTITGGKWVNHGCAECGGTNIFMYPLQGGELYITGGYFEQDLDANGDSYLLVEHGGEYANSVIDYAKTKLVVSGGTFVGMNPEAAQYFQQTADNKLVMGETTNTCAEGFVAVENSDGSWTVKPLVTVTFDDVTYVVGNEAPKFTWTSNFSDVSEDGEMLVVETPELDLTTAGEYEITANAYVFGSDKYAVKVVPGKLTIVNAVAAIGETNYATLADAIAAVQNGETIVLLADNAENVTIKQTKDLSFTIDGAKKTAEGGNYTMTGTININGNRRSTGAETLTIKNVNFVAEGEWQSSIFAVKNTYVHNLTVDGCSFTGTDAKQAYGIRLHHAYNITVKNTTGTKLYDLVYGQTAVTGFTAENITVTDSGMGFMMPYGMNMSFKNVTLDVSGAGVGIYNYNASTATFENCNITGAPAIHLEQKNATKAYTLILNGTNTFTGAEDGNWLKVLGDDAILKVEVNDTGLDLTKTNLVANIGNVYYNSLATAFKDAKDGDTVTVFADHEINGSRILAEGTYGYDAMIVLEGKQVTLDLNGKTVQVTPDCADGADGGIAGCVEAVIFLGKGTNLTVKDSVGNGGFQVNDGSDLYSLFYNSKSTLTIEGGIYNVAETVVSGALIYADQDNTTVINGGIYTLGNASADASTTKPWIFNVEGKNAGSFIQVNGGTFNQNPYMNRGTGRDCEVTIPVTKTIIQITEGEYKGYYTIGDAVAYNVQKDLGYGDVDVALFEAEDGQTVKLLVDCVSNDRVTLINAGTYLDLNGKTLSVTNIMAFGHIVDGTVGGDGGLKATGRVILNETNEFLPLFDAANSCYRFFKYELRSIDGVTLPNVANGVKFRVYLNIKNREGYKLLADTENSGLKIVVELDWTGKPENKTVLYTFEDELVEQIANAFINNPTKSYVLTVNVGGLDALVEGECITATPSLRSANTGFMVASGKINYTIPAAN